nr:MAG TPA: Major capsid protein [Caudoviricetes sp.]
MKMANSIEYAKRFMPVIDDIYKAQSITQGMDAATKVDFTGVNEVKVLKVGTTGLGDYSRTTGYPKGDITASWETLTLTEERGKELSIDRMDDEETLGMVFGTVTGNFMRDHVIPELDAYRFAKYASKTGISTTTGAVLTKDSILGAIDEAVRQMDEDEVPEEGRILYVNSDLKPILNSALTRQWGSDGTVSTTLSGYNGMRIVYVPKSRFYTGITLNDGTSSWGYAKASDAVSINFMLIYPQAILQVTKFALPKIFTPDENQDKDMWKFQFRLYHDAFVYDNKAKGIYLHKAAAE